MAFGSWFKRLGDKIKTGLRKVLPTIRKAGQIAQTVVSPVLGAIGGAVGGDKGKAIDKWGNIIGQAGGQVNKYAGMVNAKVEDARYKPGMFNVPLLKD